MSGAESDQLVHMLKAWLEGRGFQPPYSKWVASLVLIVALVVVAFVAHRLTRWLVRRGIRLRFHKAQVAWDDVLMQHGALSRLSHFVPALVFYHGSAVAFPGRSDFVEITHRLAIAYMIVAGCMAGNSIGRSVADVYEQSVGRERSIRSFIQVAEIAVWILGAILLLGNFADRSPLTILGGLGAFAAVLVLVFRDALLGLVASVQIARNDMLRVGDWIEMPSHSADGEVVEILLTTVKVQNWDRTTTMLPAHALIQHAFVSWRSIREQQARRITRSLLFDYESIQTLDPERVPSFPEAPPDPREPDGGEDPAPDPEPTTNLGAFRRYARNYLLAHPEIRDDLITLARGREPSAKGMPVEIYCFCRRVLLGEFALIEADIVEHLVSVAPQFGLRLTQLPSADAVRSIRGAA